MAEHEIFYERMTWPQLREAARADRVVLVPFGAIEQHGFHLPVDVDLRIAREVCERTARLNRMRWSWRRWSSASRPITWTGPAPSTSIGTCW